MAITGEYARAYARTSRYDRGSEVARDWHGELDEVRRRIQQFEPRGDVLELACGSGMWTRELARSAAATITAVDAAPEMLRLNREAVSNRRVRYVLANVFSWQPEQRYDCVVFGLWLSHVPPEYFRGFWDRLQLWLAPGGRVFFLDSLYAPERTACGEKLGKRDDVYITRRMDSGDEYRIVKIFYEPALLERTLAELGWTVQAEGTGRFFFTCQGSPT